MADNWQEDGKQGKAAAAHKAETDDAGSPADEEESSWVDELFAERSRQRADVLGEKTAASHPAGDGEADQQHGDSEGAADEGPSRPGSRVSVGENTFYGRLLGEMDTARENPSALLELLPFGAFLLFVLIALVLGVLSYNTMQRVDELEQANAALAASVTQLRSQMQQLETAPATAAEAENIDQQWVVDRVIEQTGPLEKNLETLAGKLQQLQAKASLKPVAVLPASTATGESAPSTNSNPAEAQSGQSQAVVDAAGREPLLLTPKPAAGEEVAGEWIINLVSLSTREAIERLRTRYQREGIAVQLQTTEVNGKTIYRLRVPGFKSREEADRYAGTIKQKLGLENIWITRQ